MPFVPLPKQADLRSVIGFYLEYMTLCRKSQSLGKDKCRYSDEVVRGLSKRAATGAARSRGRQHCLSVRNWAGSSSPTWLHSQRLFQCLAPACSGFKKLQHKFISLLLTAIRTIRKGFPSRREITDRKETRLQTWFHLHHVLCPRESQQCCRWFPEGQMLMETLNNICSSGRSIVVAKQEILVILEKFPYLPSLPWDNCLSHRPGVTDWHRISKQHSL